MAWKKEAHQYSPLSEASDQESNRTFTPDPQGRPSNSISRYLLAAITIVVTFAAGFGLGSYTAHTGPSSASADTPRISVPWKTYSFQYNATFARAPRVDNDNMAAWDSLIPKGRGWIKHPDLNDGQLSSVSAFHQLHCLNDVRRVYYSLTNSSDEALDMWHFTPSHMRHCFEYIRQELMCAADSSLEPWQDEVGGATGWQVQRQCRDYDYLKAFAEEWRADNYEGFEDVDVFNITTGEGIKPSDLPEISHDA